VHLIFSLRRFDHITDTLICLCWLHVPKHIQYKILFSLIKFFTVQLYVIWECHRALPTFLADKPSTLHQVITGLVVPSVQLSTIGDWNFAIAAPWTWNSLPESITSAPFF